MERTRLFFCLSKSIQNRSQVWSPPDVLEGFMMTARCSISLALWGRKCQKPVDTGSVASLERGHTNPLSCCMHFSLSLSLSLRKQDFLYNIQATRRLANISQMVALPFSCPEFALTALKQHRFLFCLLLFWSFFSLSPVLSSILLGRIYWNRWRNRTRRFGNWKSSWKFSPKRLMSLKV